MHGIAERIRQARTLAGLSRSALGRKVGVRPSAAVQWESPAGTAPAVKNLAEIAAVTGVSFEWLATGRGRMSLREDQVEAVLSAAYAQTSFEELVLCACRKLPRRNHDAVLMLMQCLSR